MIELIMGLLDYYGFPIAIGLLLIAIAAYLHRSGEQGSLKEEYEQDVVLYEVWERERCQDWEQVGQAWIDGKCER